MVFNKEREGRQLLAVSAASLDLTVRAASGGDAAANSSPDTQSAVVWTGRVEGLKATDPRGSNLLYSTLVGPLRPPPKGANREDCSPGRPRPAVASPVALGFRYVKEKGSGVGSLGGVSGVDWPAAAAAGGGGGGGEEVVDICENCGPWESSDLSLSFTELQV